jgi:hypothetical protein
MKHPDDDVLMDSSVAEICAKRLMTATLPDTPTDARL